jgi:DNA-binding GntR family transcriptional regulator
LNRRIRVSPLHVDDLKQLYAIRITLEALAVRLSVPSLTDADLRAMRTSLDAFLAAPRRLDIDAMEQPHWEFHLRLMSRAGSRITRELQSVHGHTERYRRLFFRSDDRLGLFRLSADEHAAIYHAVAERDEERCSHLTAEHVARAALILVARLGEAAEDPAEIRTALRTVAPRSPNATATVARGRRRAQAAV